MNKRLVYAALFGWLSWKFLLKTAITGYNLRYGMGGLAFVGYDGDSLVFDVGLDVKNPLPFDVMLYDADFDVLFNGSRMAHLQQNINRRIYGHSAQIVPVRIAIDKKFLQRDFIDFLTSGEYINWRLTLAGTVSVDYLKNFPLNIDFTIEDFVKYIIPRPV